MNNTNTDFYQKIRKYDKVIIIFILSSILYMVTAFYNDTFQTIMPVKNYLTWHTIFEFASVLVSFSIFTVIYFTYDDSKSLKMIILGSVFLLMGWLDAFHTFSYKGMPDFFIANITANRATTLWILSRVLGTLGLMISIAMPMNKISKIKKETFAIVTTAFSIILFLVVTYYPDFFPTMYIDGVGLSLIKILLEYFVIFILAITFLNAITQHSKDNSKTLYGVIIALLLLIFSESSFTNYGSIYDGFNYIGHLYKVIAFGILYKAIYVENVTSPFRELKNTKNKLKLYSEDLNVIVKQRTKELEKINEMLLNDIAYAKEVQRSLLPTQMPEDVSVSFEAEYLAADTLSGDFYNVVKLDDDNIAIYIGDVSGHGISAAMLTVFAYQNIIQLKDYREHLTEDIIEPGLIIKTLYNSFNKTNFNEEKYIVMLYGIYNINDKTFKYSSAGINVAPYIIRSSGEIHELNVKGFPICKLGEIVSPYYENRTVQLGSGDKMFFYSDGLTEARNNSGELYGEDQLKRFINENSSLNSRELSVAVKEDLFRHIEHNNELNDDVTFLTMLIN